MRAKNMRYRWIAAIILGSCCATAMAQFQWRDGRGRMVFSDQPPPPSVPASRIIRNDMESFADRAGQQAAARRAAIASRRPARRDAPAKPANPTVVVETSGTKAAVGTEQAQAAAEKTAALERRARQQARCRELRENLQTLDSGIRVARVDARGEREFLDDLQRKHQRDTTVAALAKDC
ncbi:MAG: DUF4124 domain-containing protein [Burkholderiaceae bacterium]|nr:DUF4124 domain-containing protein [Burkholderiaceae bacterium]